MVTGSYSRKISLGIYLRIELIYRTMFYMSMRESRAIIGTKGLVTLPKEWRDSHGINDDTENITAIYKMGGPLIIMPEGKELSHLEEACMDLLEKGPTVEALKEKIDAIRALDTAFTVALQEL